jgi:uncharacterized membrane protein YeaQ/YmgE (transglycosylase-associated protein family)
VSNAFVQSEPAGHHPGRNRRRLARGEGGARGGVRDPRDLLVGIIGAFIGNWLLPRIGAHLGTGIVSAFVNAAIGAIVLLLVIRLLTGGLGGGGWRGGWRRRW